MHQPFRNKTFLIFHYRSGLTDGVSLETAVWKNSLEQLGAKVYMVAGPGSIKADFIVKYFNYKDDPRIAAIDDWAFGRNPDKFSSEKEFISEFDQCRQSLTNDFESIIHQTKPDWVIVSNVFSLGENIAATVALANALEKNKIRSLLVHHDFYWGHGRSNNPATPFVKEIIRHYYPIQNNLFEHCCINTIARDQLYQRKGIRAMIITDSVNFNHVLQDRGAKCTKLLQDNGIKPNDLVILQATRIAPRKAIEVAIDFTKELTKPKNLQTLQNRGLYTGAGFDPKRDRVILLIAGYNELHDQNYMDKLVEYARVSKINCVFLEGKASGFSPLERGAKDNPTLLDLYIYADFVTYPSIIEGFGNQFLEAILSRTPIALFEYPVFQVDIKPKGFGFVSFGDTFTRNRQDFVKIPQDRLKSAVSETIEILTSPNLYRQTTEKNFQTGKVHYSIERIIKIFESVFSEDWLTRKIGYHQYGKPLPLTTRA